MRARPPAIFDQIPEKQPSTPLLEQLEEVSDLRQLTLDRLLDLADELRASLLYSVSQTGGHLAASLGVVELALALHRVFNTPIDKLIWDVGHQSYPHKMLTGRWKAMSGLRQQGGLSPFTDPAESEFDSFVTGHSSTSISAALGFALARDRRGSDEHVVAIIGDGALTAGLAYEALNHLGALGTDLTLILNDNGMSISPNVGGLANYLLRLGRREVGPDLFTSLGIGYEGPIDGHDLPLLIRQLEAARKLPGPRLLHLLTQKGKGYRPAESSPTLTHSLTKVTPAGLPKASGTSFSSRFGDWLQVVAAKDSRLMAITPAMAGGSGMNAFAKAFPDRFIDVAIAEQHAVTLAAGLAAAGQKPVLAIYSTFLQRAYDQVIHDLALQNLDVTFAIDRAGLVEDGPTHSGVFDLAFLRCVPNLVVSVPSSAGEVERLLQFAYDYPGPAVVRYPRGNAAEPVADAEQADELPVLARACPIRLSRTANCAVLAFGVSLHWLLETAEQLDTELFDMRFVKPLDVELIRELSERHQLLVTVEEHVLMGGAGSAVAEHLTDLAPGIRLMRLGIRDAFIAHGNVSQMRKDAGIDQPELRRRICQAMAGLNPGTGGLRN